MEASPYELGGVQVKITLPLPYIIVFPPLIVGLSLGNAKQDDVSPWITS